MRKILVVTGNPKKASEISSIIERETECVNISIDEIQSLDVTEVALKKAQQAYLKNKEPVIVDDTGLSVDSIGLLPGALVSWFLDGVGNDGILRLLGDEKNRRATASTAIGYADENGAHVFLGEVVGQIAENERGSGGFGYDPIFIPDGFSESYAEMSIEQKNCVSMRRIALEKLKEFLDYQAAGVEK